jgi:hypothetical protein
VGAADDLDMLPIVALAAFAVWTCVSVFVLALCAAAGRADRALDAFVGPPPAAPAEPDFVLAFAAPQTQAAPVRPPAATRTRI